MSLSKIVSAKKMVTRPKEKFETNEHANIVKVLNLFLNTTRSKNEDLEWYIARFERNYAEVKKLGESLSSTCGSVLLLRLSSGISCSSISS